MALTKVKGHIVADDLALGGNPTTTTQSASDNSTKLATTAYVTTAIANLVDGAPSTLNTLDEIAAALNDDAALNTTLTNSIATKLPLAGGTLTGALTAPQLTVDNIGINGDTITFTGSSASAFMQTSSNVFQIGTSTDDKIEIYANNAVRATILGDGNVGIGNTNPSGMHANANKLVVGTGSGDQGMSIYSGTSTGRYAFARAVGNNTDAYDGGMSYNGDRDLSFHTNAGATRMTIDGSGNVGIGETSPAKLGLTGSSAGKVLHMGGDDCQIRLANSIIHHDNSGNTILHVRNHYGATSNAAQTKIESGFITFNTDTSFAERMRILANGVLLFHTTSQGGISNGTSNIACGSLGSGQLVLATNDDIPIILNRANGSGTMLAIRNNGSNVGSITQNGSSTSFNTSSDYRLKENVDYTWDATTRLKQLKPVRFNFIADDSNTTLDGFLAHEVSSIVPGAVHGEKDDMEMQQLDHSKLVPLLVKTIQELEARIATLEG